MTVAHPKPGQPYRQVNRLRGVRQAKRDGHDEIDLDTLRSKPNPKCRTCRRRKVKCKGHDVGCHWRRPLLHDGFRDPLFRIKKDACVEDLTYEQLHRLIAPDGSRIWLTDRLLAECAKVGIGAVLEPKGDPVYETDEPWEHFAQVGDDLGVHIRMYALRNRPTEGYGSRVVPVARRNGVPGKVIH